MVLLPEAELDFELDSDFTYDPDADLNFDCDNPDLDYEEPDSNPDFEYELDTIEDLTLESGLDKVSLEGLMDIMEVIDND